jgi:hypothetical protein
MDVFWEIVDFLKIKMDVFFKLLIYIIFLNLNFKKNLHQKHPLFFDHQHFRTEFFWVSF